MMLIQFTAVCLTIVSLLFTNEIDASINGFSGGLDDYLVGDVKSAVTEVKNPPENRNSSIQYILYKQSDPSTPCYLEPNKQSIRKCLFDPRLPTVFAIHGFMVKLYPGNLFEVMKNVVLLKENYNFIIVNWTLYNQQPYALAVENVYVVGSKVADFIDYMKKNAGLKPGMIYLIGHSLGAHMAGHIGRSSPDIAKITALDPAGVNFEVPIGRVSSRDANFVEVVHTSSSELGLGLGLYTAVGHMDFYPNGGKFQPHCRYGNIYQSSDGIDVEIDSLLNWIFCHHEMSVSYFIQSINSTDCHFLGVMCSSYRNFKRGECPAETHVIGDMGIYGQKINGFPPMSKFYLTTNEHSLFCKTDGYEPIR